MMQRFKEIMLSALKRLVMKESVLFLIGGFIYYIIEVLYRGYSHWSMFILGGVCFVIIGILNEFFKWELLFQYQCLIGATVITVLEFVTGCIVNLWLGWNIWDYSDMPMNIMGQICLPFSAIWFALSSIAIVVDDLIRYFLFDEQFPKYYFTKKK